MMDDGRTQYYGKGPEGLSERLRRRPRGKGIFGGNRSLLIIFIDVIIILVIYAIFTFFLSGPTSSRTVEGYRFSLSANVVESTAVATLRISPPAGAGSQSREGPPPESSEQDPIVTVRFFPGAVDGVEDPVKDVLPASGRSERVFQRTREVGEETEMLSVQVEALGRSFVLETSLGD